MSAVCRRRQFVTNGGVCPAASFDWKEGDYLKTKCHFKKRSGEGTPLVLAIVFVLLMLFCAIAEYSRVWIISQGVK